MDYKPLDATRNEVRLLSILPRSSSVAAEKAEKPVKNLSSSIPSSGPEHKGTVDVIHCTLEHVSLNEWTPAYLEYIDGLDSSITRLGVLQGWLHLPRESIHRFSWGDFVALSYTWQSGEPGIPDVPRDIIVNDRVVEVTQNLEAALRVIRDEPETQAGFKLWVDALCINQKDHVERNKQVRRMRDIYSKAWNVIAFLSEKKHDQAIDFITTMVSQYHNRHKEFRTLLQSWLTGPMRNEHRRVWVAMSNLFHRPYWRRLWVIQELAMGGDSTTILCGTRRLLMRNLFSIADLIAPAYAASMPTFARELGIEGSQQFLEAVARICQIRAISQRLVQRSAAPRLDTILVLAHNSMETDARDKVYGLLGIMDPGVASRITPDYRLPILEVYIDFVKSMIGATGKLNVIFAGNRVRLQETWPSWVLDWRLDPARDLWRFQFGYQASGGTRAGVQFLDNGLLLCRGFQFDTIDGVSHSGFSNTGVTENGITSSTAQGHQYGEDEALTEALRRAFISEPASELQSRGIELRRSVLDIPWVIDIEETHDKSRECGWTPLFLTIHYQKFKGFRQVNGAFNIFGRPFKSFFPQSMTECGDPSDLLFALQSFALALTGRKLITTAKGYLGLGMDPVQPGDAIFILFGCDCPIILRPHGEHYKVVGECFLDGLMDGEAVKCDANGDCPADDIILC